MKVNELLVSVSPSQREEARYLISEYLSCSIAELVLRNDQELSSHDQDVLLGWMEQLRAGEPPQYISGRAWFYGNQFELSPAVLIPRPDTEVLVERVAAQLKGNERVLDIGTGSGIIAITLAHLFPQLTVHATDIDAEALLVAGGNAIQLDTRVSFFHTDLYPEDWIQYDVIISNPPYISAAGYARLESRVRDYEPRLALWGGADGLQYYRRILAGADKHLKPSGWIALEHGYDQRDELVVLASESGMEILECGRDLAGNERYMILKRTNSRG